MHKIRINWSCQANFTWHFDYITTHHVEISFQKNCLSKFIENTQTIFTYLVFDPSKSTERNRKLMPWIICIKLTTTINLTISIIHYIHHKSLKFSSQRQKKIVQTKLSWTICETYRPIRRKMKRKPHDSTCVLTCINQS